MVDGASSRVFRILFGLLVAVGALRYMAYGWVEPRASSEDTAARDQMVYGYWVNLPLDAPVSGVDAVVLFGTVDEATGELVGGEDYQVVGQPGRQPGGFIVPGFVKAAVEKVTG